MIRCRVGLPLIALVALAAALPGRASPAQTQPAVADTFDVKDCGSCHEKQAGSKFQQSHHAGLEQSCTKCHEGAVDHAKGQMEGKDTPGPSLLKAGASKVVETCLGCHAKHNQENFGGSAHDRRGVSCINCHSVHDYKSDKAQIKTAQVHDTCFNCHKDMRARALRTSHHPVREGLMTCTSCHNPHDGSRPKMIKADWTNELCYQCHQEKRGPFLWEHAPVRENCLNCHNPHGSNHDKMLVAKLPYLCQRCHLNTRHPGTFYDGRSAGTQSVATATNRAVEHACKNCHQAIHGSNAPSAPYFGR